MPAMLSNNPQWGPNPKTGHQRNEKLNFRKKIGIFQTFKHLTYFKTQVIRCLPLPFLFLCLPNPQKMHYLKKKNSKQ